ncbi:MAG TPA: hypothetical protein VJ810_39555 [Blastocatellia bacterium]|nr:hypothetical protein [Blastocatellia bacterium]
MQITQILQRCGIVFLILLSGAMVACNGGGNSVNTYKIKQLERPRAINVDSSLSEWDISFIVLEITPQNASKHQWKDIRGERPDRVVPNDFGIKVYMARDKSYWFIALDATDDKVIRSNPPYSGDCLEVFFTGKQLDSPIEMSGLVNVSANQAALFQLTLPAADLDDKNNLDSFPRHRTDDAFKDSKLIRSEFVANMWVTNNGWSAEARIPLEALEPEVLGQLNGKRQLKMNIDYLDYDVRPAVKTTLNKSGFKPDNVFCLDDEEKRVNVPKYMRTVMFE